MWREGIMTGYNVIRTESIASVTCGASMWQDTQPKIRQKENLAKSVSRYGGLTYFLHCD